VKSTIKLHGSAILYELAMAVVKKPSCPIFENTVTHHIEFVSLIKEIYRSKLHNILEANDNLNK